MPAFLVVPVPSRPPWGGGWVAGLRLLKYLPPGSSDSLNCLWKHRGLDGGCYDITPCVCAPMMRQNDKAGGD